MYALRAAPEPECTLLWGLFDSVRSIFVHISCIWGICTCTCYWWNEPKDNNDIYFSIRWVDL